EYGAQSMRDGVGKPVFHTAPRARGCDLDPVCELPYRPAATERPQQRPNRCQHLTTRTTVPKILLALTEASTDVKTAVGLESSGGDRLGGYGEALCRTRRESRTTHTRASCVLSSAPGSCHIPRMSGRPLRRARRKAARDAT